MAVALAIFLPLSALSLYLYYGSPRLPDQPLLARLQAPASNKNLEVLVARVEARLREQPEEGEGWDVIAPVYMGWRPLRRCGRRLSARHQAARRIAETARRLGKALVLANDGVVTEDARKALERALVLDPNLIDARLLLIIAKEQDGKLAAAAERLARYACQGSRRCAMAAAVEQRLAEDEAQVGREGGCRQANDRPPRQTADGRVRRGADAPAERQAMIESMVRGSQIGLTRKATILPAG